MKFNDNFDTDVNYLKGVGPKRSKFLQKLGVFTVEDLLELYPRDYITRAVEKKIDSLMTGESVSLVVRIVSVKNRTNHHKKQLTIYVTDGYDYLECKWFRFSNWLTTRLIEGKMIWVSGQITEFAGKLQLIHPEIDFLDKESMENDFMQKRNILPVYRLSGDLTMKSLREIIYNAFMVYQNKIEENLPRRILDKYKFESRKDALFRVHFPGSIEEARLNLKRFKYEELFFNQLMLVRSKYKITVSKKGYSFKLKKTFTTALKNSLPFKLTSAQKKVIREIAFDMNSNKQMNRLLQGDVGSGKTIVMLFAMLLALENGFQAVLMAPTEILAEQHYASIKKYLESKNLRKIQLMLLRGGVYRGKEDDKAQILSGKVNIIVGTHALLEEDVVFKNVGFVAIDEQHRFGVRQRSVLIEKDRYPDTLYLSATPIPRSLALTLYGELDISVIDEMPPSRKSIKTIWRGEKNLPDVYHFVDSQISKGRQVYVVCPLVKESEKMDLIDATNLYDSLQGKIFPHYSCALLHGKMPAIEKKNVMQDFINGCTKILVSTTVIEVGIDVPNATVMIIHHAERFGLSQLHQLRGRVGRGTEESFCFLIGYYPMSGVAKERLKTMVSSDDGFYIAEKDLEIRGPGEFFGTSQSGLPFFKCVNISKDQDILLKAREDAIVIVETDFNLETSENKQLRAYYSKKFLHKEKLFSY